MKKTILEVYALAVCFTAVVCFVIASGIGLYAVVGVVKPELTLSSWEYDRHRNNKVFRVLGNPPPFGLSGKGTTEVERLSEEELTRRREESLRHAIRAEQRGNLQTLIRVAIILFVDMVVFLIHWRIARQARQEDASA